MIHKQISLPEALHHQIRQRAKRLHASEEQVIRDLLVQSLGTAGQSNWRNGGEALRTLSQLGINGPADLATKHDDEYRAEQP